MSLESGFDETRRGKAWPLALAVFILALSVRLIYLYSYHRSGYWDIMALDPETHDMLARRIARGEGIGERAYFRAPLYIYALGAVYKIFEPGYLAPRLIQAVVGSCSMSLIYLLARRLVHGPWPVLAGLAASIYWIFVYFDGELLVDGLSLFLDLAALYVLVSGLDGKGSEPLSGGRCLALGLIMGLGAITRPNILLFSIAVVLIMIVRYRRHGIKAAALVLAGLALPIVPVTARNMAVSHDPVLISSQGGINFYMGNNPEADGRTAVAPYARRDMPSRFIARYKSDPWFKEDVWLSALYGAETSLGRPAKESEVSRYWYSRSLEWISSHPVAWLKLMIKKSFFLIHSSEVSNNRDLSYHLEQAPFLKALSHFHFGLICPLFLLGMAFGMARLNKWIWLEVFVVAYGFSVILFFVNSRYRLPIVPAAFIFAAGAASRVVSGIKERRLAFVASSAAVLVFLAWFCNADLVRFNPRPLRAAMRYNLGLAFLRANRYDGAEKELRAAVGIKDQFPEAHLALGNALAAGGKERDALNEYKIALLQNPGYAEAHYNMGLTYMRLKNIESARIHFIEAHKRAPEMFPLQR